jgi:hypothetical protein
MFQLFYTYAVIVLFEYFKSRSGSLNTCTHSSTGKSPQLLATRQPSSQQHQRTLHAFWPAAQSHAAGLRTLGLQALTARLPSCGRLCCSSLCQFAFLASPNPTTAAGRRNRKQHCSREQRSGQRPGSKQQRTPLSSSCPSVHRVSNFKYSSFFHTPSFSFH